MGAASSCTGKLDIVSEEEIQAAIKSIKDWEDTQKAGQRAAQAMRTVRKDSFKKAANELNHKGGIVERIGGPDRVHDLISVFYRKLFGNEMVRHFFENLPSDRMRAKQMKFMRYIMGGPGTYVGNLRCIHAQMVAERGLDLEKFMVVQQLLIETFRELGIPQDVADDVLEHVEAAKMAIFTPNADELVSSEEMVGAATELQHPLVTKLGGPHTVQAIVQAFYKKLFTNEELKYFFVSMSTERLRNMQFKFMRYLFAGAAGYAQTGGNMRCVHARMVKDNGLDLPKFNMVVQMLVDVMNEQMVSKANMREVLNNCEAAKEAIFTPGADELVTKEEMMAEAATLDSQLVARVGGPEAVYELISRFYARLFNDEQLKFFFTLSADRLRTKQFRFMRYLMAGPAAYAAMGGNLRCKHLALIRDKGLDTDKFDKVVGMLAAVMTDLGIEGDVEGDIFKNVAAARSAIFTPGQDELISREELMAAADALKSDLVVRMGGSARVYNVVSSFYSKLFNDEQLKYFFVSLSEQKLRGKQFKVMAYLFGGPPAYAAASPGNNLRCVHAKMVKEDGLDLTKFNRVVEMILETLIEEDVPEDVIADIVKNVDAARAAIFTPGADELVSKEEMMAEAATLDCDMVTKLGGPEAVYELISYFYARLFNDEELKYFFTLSADRLRTKQFKFMRYLVAGPSHYTGDLRCVHANMVSERGLTAAKFNRAVAHLTTALAHLSVPAEVVAQIMKNVDAAKEAILGGAAGGVGGGSRPASAAAAGGGGLYGRLGGDVGVGKMVDALHAQLQANPLLAHIYAGVDMVKQRRQQLAFLRTALGGGGGGGGGAVRSRPASSASAKSGGSAGGGGMTLGIAHAHLARDKALNAAHFEAIAQAWTSCLVAEGAPANATAELRGLLVPGQSLLYPPGPAAGCPFAASMSLDDESALDAIIAAAAAGTPLSGSAHVSRQPSAAGSAAGRPAAAAAGVPGSKPGSKPGSATRPAGGSAGAPRGVTPLVGARSAGLGYLGDDEERLLEALLETSSGAVPAAVKAQA